MHDQDQPFVSVVMCVYNGERFLQEQLESVLNQTYTNFELLIIDDSSTDKSYSILKSYQLKHPNKIRLFQNEKNIGFNRNFEKGILLSKGEFISICDQDDIWFPEKIEELVSTIGEAHLIYSNSELIDEEGNALNRTLAHKLIHVNDPCFKAFLDSNFITGHTCLFRRELVEYIFPLPPEVTYYDKWIGLVAAYIGDVKYHDKVLTRYRIHTASVIGQVEQSEAKHLRSRKIRDEITAFSRKEFVKKDDQDFIEQFLHKKRYSRKGFKQYVECYMFLLKNHGTIYPWYSKPFVKKLNFLRKQCQA